MRATVGEKLSCESSREIWGMSRAEKDFAMFSDGQDISQMIDVSGYRYMP
jgi:hypothetical protein